MKMIIILVMLFVVFSAAMEEPLSQDKRGSVDDVLSSFFCRHLKIKGYLAKNVYFRKLCLKTYHCNDILSKQCCRALKSKNECTKYSTLILTYCPFTCDKCGAPQCKVSVPLGMQSKAIHDSKITASTYHNNKYLPYKARLHMNSYGWTPKTRRLGDWLQVDLSSVGVVTDIATQGSKLHTAEWMKSYSLQYSVDGSAFHKYKAGKVFAANVDKNTVVKHDLNPPIRARYIRIYPKTWHNWPSMRMELYGCK